MLELLGSEMILEMFKFSGILTRTQVEFALEIFVFFQRPPLTPPAKTVSFVLSLGSNIMALVLPPTLSGPLEIQLLSAASPGTLADISLLS